MQGVIIKNILFLSGGYIPITNAHFERAWGKIGSFVPIPFLLCVHVRVFVRVKNKTTSIVNI